MPLQFGWDERKRRSNLRKHGVDFLDVTRMFENHVAETIDDREDYSEERIIAIGRVGVEVYRVVYAPRDGVIRIISAQKASRREKEGYFRYILNG